MKPEIDLSEDTLAQIEKDIFILCIQKTTGLPVGIYRFLLNKEALRHY